MTGHGIDGERWMMSEVRGKKDLSASNAITFFFLR